MHPELSGDRKVCPGWQRHRQEVSLDTRACLEVNLCVRWSIVYAFACTHSLVLFTHYTSTQAHRNTLQCDPDLLGYAHRQKGHLNNAFWNLQPTTLWRRSPSRFWLIRMRVCVQPIGCCRMLGVHNKMTTATLVFLVLHAHVRDLIKVNMRAHLAAHLYLFGSEERTNEQIVKWKHTCNANALRSQRKRSVCCVSVPKFGMCGIGWLQLWLITE